MAPRDTSSQAFEIQMDLLRRAGPEARVAMAADMTDVVHELVMAMIRRRDPTLDERMVREAAIDLLYGERSRLRSATA